MRPELYQKSDHEREWTIADLEGIPQPLDDTRYEIIAGELHVSTQPHINHQIVTGNVIFCLRTWVRQTGLGVVIPAPGVIFSARDAVAPDVVWVVHEIRRGKLYTAPELVVEVLSAGSQNEFRDRVKKLALYSERGVREYWIVDWRRRRVEVFRSERDSLSAVATLSAGDELRSPLLPGFQVSVDELFEDLLDEESQSD
jgi:Uma2 family endonuclease